jgi:hypothetical protein
MTFFTLEVRDLPRAARHVLAPEPSLVVGRGPVLWDTWQHRSSPRWGDEVRSQGTHDSTKALLSREVKSGAMGHMAASELSSMGRRGPKPWDP